MDKKSQLLAFGVLCKLMQKIESADVVKRLGVFFSYQLSGHVNCLSLIIMALTY